MEKIRVLRSSAAVETVWRLLRRYQVEGRIGVQTLYAFATSTVAVGVERLLVYPYIVRHFGYEDFGRLILAIYWVMLVAGSVSTGIATVLLRRIPDYSEEEAAGSLRSGIGVGTLATAGLLSLLMIPGRLRVLSDDPAFFPLFSVLIIYGLAVCAGSVANTWFRARLQIGTYYVLQALLGVSTLFVIPAARVVGQAALPLGYIAGAVISLNISIWLIPRWVWQERSTYSGRTVFWEGAQITAASLLSLLLVTADKTLVGWYGGSEGVGLYFAVYTVVQMFLFPAEVFAGVLLPHLATKRLSELVVTKERFIVLAGLLAGLVLLAGWMAGPWLVDTLYGDGAAARSSLLFTILLLGTTASIVGTLFRPVVVVRCPPRLMIVINGVSLLALASLGPFFGRAYGLIGVAAASVVATAVRSLLLTRTAMRVLPGRRNWPNVSSLTIPGREDTRQEDANSSLARAHVEASAGLAEVGPGAWLR